MRAVSWNPWDNSSFLQRSFPSLCNPLQNESCISGRGKGCQELGANDESPRKVMNLHFPGIRYLGGTRLFCHRVISPLTRERCPESSNESCCLDFRSLRLENSWGSDRRRETTHRKPDVWRGQRESPCLCIPGFLGWVYSLKVHLEKSH